MAHQSWNTPSTAPPCPAPMTRATLLALRSAGQLRTECPYTITDHVQGRLVAGTLITLRAVAANELSEAVDVNTTYDNEAWSGIYDLDRGIVLELTDNRGNVARGINGSEVSNFDWGNTRFTNVLVDNSTLTVTYGSTGGAIFNVEIKSGSNVNLTGFTGTLNHFEVEIVSNVNLTNANGIWRYGKVIENSTLNAAGYTGGGDSYYFEISDASNVNVANTAAAVNFRTSNLHAATVIATGLAATTGGVTLLGCNIWQSTITKGATTSGATNLTRLDMRSTSQVNHTTGSTFSVTNTEVTASSNITQSAAGDLLATTTVASSTISHQSGINNFSTSAVNITRLHAVMNGAVQKDFGSGGGFTVNDTTVSSQGYVRKLAASTAGALSLSACEFTQGGFAQTAGTGNLTMAQCAFQGASGVVVSAGARNYSFTRVVGREVARLNLSGTSASLTTLNDVEMYSRGSFSDTSSGANNTLQYAIIAGLSGAINFTGTTGNQSVNRLKAYDGSLTFANCTANTGAALCTAADAGIITFNGIVAPKTYQYIEVRNNATATFNNTTGGGTSTNIFLDSGASFTQSGPAANATRVHASIGAVVHNGGSLTNLSKTGTGTLTTGNFNHTNIFHHSHVSRTLTAANNNRSEFANTTSAAPLI